MAGKKSASSGKCVSSSELAELFSVLSDPSRIAIVRSLSSGPKGVSAIASETGVSISAVSHQLRLLRQRKMVSFSRSGTSKEYSLSDFRLPCLLNNAVSQLSLSCTCPAGAAYSKCKKICGAFK